MNDSNTFQLFKCDKHKPEQQYRHLESIPVVKIFPGLEKNWDECVTIFRSLESDDNDVPSGFFIPNTQYHIGAFLYFYAHNPKSFLLKVTELRDNHRRALYPAFSYYFCTADHIMFTTLNLEFSPRENAVETVCTPDFINVLRNRIAAKLPDSLATPAIESYSKPSGPSEPDL